MPLEGSRGGRVAARQDPRQFLRNEIADRLFDGFSPDDQARTMWKAMPRQLGVEMANIPVDQSGKPFYGTIEQGKTFQDLAGRVVGNKKSSGTGGYGSVAKYEDSLAKAYGVDGLTDEVRAKELERAQGRQKFVGSVRGVATDASLTAFENLDSGIAQNIDEAYELLGQLMPTVGEQIRAKAGPAAADGFQARIKAKIQGGDIQGALDEVGLTAEQLKGVIGNPEVNTVEGFTAPLLKDLPPWGQAAAIGATGAGAGALAYHLMAQGQQQQSTADYAAMAQAMNAY